MGQPLKRIETIMHMGPWAGPWALGMGSGTGYGWGQAMGPPQKTSIKYLPKVFNAFPNGGSPAAVRRQLARSLPAARPQPGGTCNSAPEEDLRNENPSLVDLAQNSTWEDWDPMVILTAQK